jgi:hypothetical protein
VLTFPFSWRRRLAQDGALLGRLTRLFVQTVHAFYASTLAAREGAVGAKTGAVSVVQRTSSDLRLDQHLHAVFLDGAWHERGGELTWQGLRHLKTSEVGEVLERLAGGSRGIFGGAGYCGSTRMASNGGLDVVKQPPSLLPIVQEHPDPT